MEPGASIIIVTFNSASTISECLISVAHTLRPQDEVVVLDNKSHDNTLDVIERLDLTRDPRIKIIPLSENFGFSRACNLGIVRTNKEFVILLNPDTSVFGDWIARLTKHFDYYPRTGAVGPLSNSVIQTQHVVTYFPQYHDYLYRADDLIRRLAELFGKRSFPTNMLIGFCLALRRDLLERFGGLDEDIFLGDDDLEISWRLRENGYLLRVALDVFINHAHHTSFNTLPESETDKIVVQGSDVLYEKMKAHYAPAKVPHPLDYFGIGWWRPSILDRVPVDEAFRPKTKAQDYTHTLREVKARLQSGRVDEAAGLVQEYLQFFVRDFPLWYTFGSICMKLRRFEEAELALLNAWSLEFDGVKAKTRLQKLVHHLGQEDKYEALLGNGHV